MKQTYRKELFAVGLIVLLFIIVWADLSFARQQGVGIPFSNPLSSGISGNQVMNSGSAWSDSRWWQHSIAALLGAFVGGFFSQSFRKYRRWITLGLIILGALSGTVASMFLGNIVIFILSAGVVYYFLREAVSAVKRKKPTTFGSAEWADLEHLEKNGLIGKGGFFLGVFPTKEGNHPLHYTGDRHLLTVAPTRSGKGVSSIIPNLLTYQGSAVVIDPKGENAMITALRRGKGDKKRCVQGLGQTVHVVDPWGITGLPSSSFNPLDWLNPTDSDVNENAMILADSIVTPHAGGHDQFWDEEAKALLMGILLYVALDEKEKESRTLGRVRDIISMGTKDLDEILREMVQSQNHIVSSAGARTITKEDKLKSNVLATLQSHTHFLDSPRIRENLKKSDFKFEDLKTSKVTLYLVLPADRLGAFGRWLRLLIQQALTVNARNIEVKPEKPILFLLDEMATLGRLAMVEQAYGLMAGFGMQLWGIVQDLSQLGRIYGDGWQTFIGNSGVIQYFGSRDLKTAEYFSKLCGVATIEKFSIGRSIARALSSSTSSPGNSSSSGSSTTYSDSVTEDVVQRHLAFPDELMVMRDNKEIVFVESLNPIPAKKVAWFEDEDLKNLGVNLHEPPKKPQGKRTDNVFEEPAPDSSKKTTTGQTSSQSATGSEHSGETEKNENERLWASLEKGDIQAAFDVLKKSGYTISRKKSNPDNYKIKAPTGKITDTNGTGVIRMAKGVLKNTEGSTEGSGKQKEESQKTTFGETNYTNKDNPYR